MRPRAPNTPRRDQTRSAPPGLYVGVWVQGPEGTQDLYYRLFTR